MSIEQAFVPEELLQSKDVLRHAVMTFLSDFSLFLIRNHFFEVIMSAMICLLLLLLQLVKITTGGNGYSLPTSELNALKDLWIATKGARWDYLTPYDTYGYPWNFTNSQFSNPCNQTFHWQGVNCSSTCLDSPCYVNALVLHKLRLSGKCLQLC
jgi:hypothetical protein